MCAWRKAIVVKEIKVIKKRPDLYWNKLKGALKERPYPVKLSAYKSKSPRVFFLFLESNCKQKLVLM